MRLSKVTLPTEDVTLNITPNFMKAHLLRKGWEVLRFGRHVCCIDPLDKRWSGTVADAYRRQVCRESSQPAWREG